MAARAQETDDSKESYSKWGTLIEEMGERSSQVFLHQYIRHHHNLSAIKSADHRRKLVSTDTCVCNCVWKL